MIPENGDNNWEAYRRLVLHALKENADELGRIHRDLVSLRSDIVALKIKSGVWGLFGGVLTALVLVAFKLLD